MVKNGWFCCPKCGWKLFPIDKETRISKLRFKCKHCRHEFEVNI